MLTHYLENLVKHYNLEAKIREGPTLIKGDKMRLDGGPATSELSRGAMWVVQKRCRESRRAMTRSNGTLSFTFSLSDIRTHTTTLSLSPLSVFGPC